jgi:hypothetical protein
MSDNRQMSIAMQRLVDFIIMVTNSTFVPGGYKYGNLALQVGGVSDETVKYGREFCGTSAQG